MSGVVPARTQNHRYQIMWQIVWHCNYSNYRIGIESSEISVDESLFQTVRFLDFWSIILQDGNFKWGVINSCWIFSDCRIRPHTSNHLYLPSPDWPIFWIRNFVYFCWPIRRLKTGMIRRVGANPAIWKIEQEFITPQLKLPSCNGNQNLDRILRVDRTIYKSGLPYHKIWVAIRNFPKDRIRQCDSNRFRTTSRTVRLRLGTSN